MTVRRGSVAVALLALCALSAGSAAAGVPAERPREELRFRDPAITESSGLVVRGRDVLTVNDSGSGPVVYVVDAATGETVGRTTYSTEEAVDVEALAAGRGRVVWVGDIGDNDRERPQVSLFRLPEVARGDRTVVAQRFDLAYPGGPQDAETLLVHPRTGRVLVVTKGVFFGRVYAAPRALRADRVNRLRPVGRTGGLVTDGTFLPDGASVVLRDYSDGFVVDPATWEMRGSFPMPRQQQAEAVAPWPTGEGEATRVLASSEGANAPLFSVPVPDDLLRTEASEGDGRPGPEQEPGDRQDDPTHDEDESARVSIPWGPAAAGAAVLVVLTLGGFWAVRRRVGR